MSFSADIYIMVFRGIENERRTARKEMGQEAVSTLLFPHQLNKSLLFSPS
jgi:hypothetical protein